MSRPSRTRGLKQSHNLASQVYERVASLADAWIETCWVTQSTRIARSRPSRTRGLKQIKDGYNRDVGCRVPRGRVDRNYQSHHKDQDQRSRPSRTRGLKHHALT